MLLINHTAQPLLKVGVSVFPPFVFPCVLTGPPCRRPGYEAEFFHMIAHILGLRYILLSPDSGRQIPYYEMQDMIELNQLDIGSAMVAYELKNFNKFAYSAPINQLEHYFVFKATNESESHRENTLFITSLSLNLWLGLLGVFVLVFIFKLFLNGLESPQLRHSQHSYRRIVPIALWHASAHLLLQDQSCTTSLGKRLANECSCALVVFMWTVYIEVMKSKLILQVPKEPPATTISEIANLVKHGPYSLTGYAWDMDENINDTRYQPFRDAFDTKPYVPVSNAKDALNAVVQDPKGKTIAWMERQILQYHWKEVCRDVMLVKQANEGDQYEGFIFPKHSALVEHFNRQLPHLHSTYQILIQHQAGNEPHCPDIDARRMIKLIKLSYDETLTVSLHQMSFLFLTTFAVYCSTVVVIIVEVVVSHVKSCI